MNVKYIIVICVMGMSFKAFSMQQKTLARQVDMMINRVKTDIGKSTCFYWETIRSSAKYTHYTLGNLQLIDQQVAKLKNELAFLQFIDQALKNRRPDIIAHTISEYPDLFWSNMKRLQIDVAQMLPWAAWHGNTRLMRILLEKGINPNFTYPDGNSPLLISLAKNNPAAIQVLFYYGADSTSALIHCCVGNMLPTYTIACMNRLERLYPGSVRRFRRWHGKSLIGYAKQHNNQPVVKYLERLTRTANRLPFSCNTHSRAEICNSTA